MIEYIAKTEIGGAEIRLIKSRFAYVVIYGTEKTTHKGIKDAVKGYKLCVKHAFDCLGLE